MAVFGKTWLLASALPNFATPTLVATGDAALVGETNQLQPQPLSIFLHDGFGNPLAEVGVEFSIVRGGGKVDNQDSIVLPTGDDGRAYALWTLGPEEGIDTQLVQVVVDDGPHVEFVASSYASAPSAATVVSGRVLDNVNAPLSGVEVFVGNVRTTTDAGGEFVLTGVTGNHVHLIADGTTAGPYPSLEFELHLIQGIDNKMDRPIFLPAMDELGQTPVGPDRAGLVERSDLPGLRLEIEAGSAHFGDGSSSGIVQIIPVNFEKIPMPLPDGGFTSMVFSIQPAHVTFDPPARIRLPNSDGLEPGTLVDLMSFNHDVGRYVIVGTAQVSEDGSSIKSGPGQGVVHGGWHATPARVVDNGCLQSSCGLLYCDEVNDCRQCNTAAPREPLRLPRVNFGENDPGEGYSFGPIFGEERNAIVEADSADADCYKCPNPLELGSDPDLSLCTEACPQLLRKDNIVESCKREDDCEDPLESDNNPVPPGGGVHGFTKCRCGYQRLATVLCPAFRRGHRKSP